jgi:hypothetical protein
LAWLARYELNFYGVMVITFGLAAVAALAWTQGWFWWLILGETLVAIGLYSVLRRALARMRWSSAE